MNLFGIGFVAVLIIIAVLIINSILKSKKIKNIENKELLPILEYLYKNPNEQSKYRDYFDKIKLIDQQVKKDSTALYSPGEFVFIFTGSTFIQVSYRYTWI